MFYRRIKNENEKIFDVLQELYQECKEDMNVPTQILFGLKCFQEFTNDERCSKYFLPSKNYEIIDRGFKGYLTSVPIYVNYIEENIFNIEENEIVFVIGEKI